MKTEDEPTRAIAGLILKNNAKVYYASFPAEIKSFIKQEAIQAIGDPSPLIRATAGTLISTIAMRGELTNWPELLPTLFHFIEDPNYTMCEVTCTPLTYSVPYLLSGVGCLQCRMRRRRSLLRTQRNYMVQTEVRGHTLQITTYNMLPPKMF